MKGYLIEYDTDCNSEKNLLIFVYEKSYDLAIDKLKKEIEQPNKFGGRKLIRFRNRTIE
jgi:hypothetical protein